MTGCWRSLTRTSMVLPSRITANRSGSGLNVTPSPGTEPMDCQSLPDSRHSRTTPLTTVATVFPSALSPILSPGNDLSFRGRPKSDASQSHEVPSPAVRSLSPFVVASRAPLSRDPPCRFRRGWFSADLMNGGGAPGRIERAGLALGGRRRGSSTRLAWWWRVPAG
jgi:hypothetical protein